MQVHGEAVCEAEVQVGPLAAGWSLTCQLGVGCGMRLRSQLARIGYLPSLWVTESFCLPLHPHTPWLAFLWKQFEEMGLGSTQEAQKSEQNWVAKAP